MDIIIKTRFQSITHQIEFQPATVTKGQNLALAEHVRDVEEHRRNNDSFLIKSRIIRQASVHSTPYITSLNVIKNLIIYFVVLNNLRVLLLTGLSIILF